MFPPPLAQGTNRGPEDSSGMGDAGHKAAEPSPGRTHLLGTLALIGVGVCYSAWAAVTLHTGQLTQQKCVSSQSWRLKPKIKVQQRWYLRRRLGSWVAHLLAVSSHDRPCVGVAPHVQMSSSYKDTSQTGSGDTPRASVYHNYLCKGLQKQSHSEY